MARFDATWFRELSCFLRGAYPSFVTARHPSALASGEVPAFIFHTIRSESFEAQLQHLARNGYHTLSADETYGFLTQGRAVAPKAVVLTADDGEAGLHRVALPLLRKYGMRLIAFVVPGRLTETAGDGAKRWLTWRELRELADSGCVDVQSHTRNHERMFVGHRVCDFVHPGLFVESLGTEIPQAGVGDGIVALDTPGLPIYRPMASRMEARPKFLDDERLREACVRWVREHGGPDFFSAPDWRAQLLRQWRAARREAGDHGRFETPAEQRAAILDALRAARTMLEQRLDRPVLDLAYPWAEASPLAVELSREAGYRSNYWGPLPGVPANRSGQDPYRIARLKDDYILRLPGEGQWTLAQVFRAKWQRRRALRDIY